MQLIFVEHMAPRSRRQHPRDQRVLLPPDLRRSAAAADAAGAGAAEPGWLSRCGWWGGHQWDKMRHGWLGKIWDQCGWNTWDNGGGISHQWEKILENLGGFNLIIYPLFFPIFPKMWISGIRLHGWLGKIWEKCGKHLRDNGEFVHSHFRLLKYQIGINRVFETLGFPYWCWTQGVEAVEEW